jgi:hypothetical protein
LATTVGRVRRRPYWSTAIALAAIAVFSFVVASVRDKAAKVDRESPRVTAWAEASTALPVAPSVTPPVASAVTGPSVTTSTSVTPQGSIAPRFEAIKMQKTFVPKKSKNTANHRDDNAAGI